MKSGAELDFDFERPQTDLAFAVGESEGVRRGWEGSEQRLQVKTEEVGEGAKAF